MNVGAKPRVIYAELKAQTDGLSDKFQIFKDFKVQYIFTYICILTENQNNWY